jgi:hypothetical protein
MPSRLGCLDIPRDWPSFDARLWNHHELFRVWRSFRAKCFHVRFRGRRGDLPGSRGALAKLNMSCIYSSACVCGLAALAVGISSIPLLFVLWRVVRAPVRTWVPLLFFLGVILLVQGTSELIGPDGMMALIYILAGVR